MIIKTIFDTSALLAIINNEPGAEVVQNHISSAGMCTANIAEVVTYLVRNDYTDEIKLQQIINLVKPIALDVPTAINAGTMTNITKKLGLSLGDRSCLATAKLLDIPVYTADKKWSEIAKQIGVQVIQIR